MLDEFLEFPNCLLSGLLTYVQHTHTNVKRPDNK